MSAVVLFDDDQMRTVVAVGCREDILDLSEPAEDHDVESFGDLVGENVGAYRRYVQKSEALPFPLQQFNRPCIGIRRHDFLDVSRQGKAQSSGSASCVADNGILPDNVIKLRYDVLI